MAILAGQTPWGRMRRGMVSAALCLGLLAGCNLSGAGGAAVEKPVFGDAITVTSLDAPAAAAAPGIRPKPRPVVAAAAVDVPPEPTPKPTPEPPAAAPVSLEERACVRSRGQWVHLGRTSLRTCVRQTTDSGKRCTRESQCQGLCLARSGTCAPVVPLFGCNEILQDDGRRVTLCID